MCLKYKGQSNIRGTSNPEYGNNKHNECNDELVPYNIVQLVVMNCPVKDTFCEALPKSIFSFGAKTEKDSEYLS